MTKTYIYIDDSGDSGLRSEGSTDFIIASVVLVGQEERDQLLAALDNYKKGLGWNNREELKFHKTHKDEIRLAIKIANKYKYSAYAFVLDKTKLNSANINSSEKGSAFLYTIKELLLHIGISDADIIIDGVRGPKYTKKARIYLRRELKTNKISTGRISFEDSKSNSLIQLADLVAGSVARSLTNKDNARDYIKLFGNNLKSIYKN